MAEPGLISVQVRSPAAGAVIPGPLPVGEGGGGPLPYGGAMYVSSAPPGRSRNLPGQHAERPGDTARHGGVVPVIAGERIASHLDETSPLEP
ncbi:hypothetical protein [Nonomuraea rubra]|uniref:hypothetical protein n=1 Tax=Nonomuraea rubra TaxID=46180 RepID=UPI0031EA1475